MSAESNAGEGRRPRRWPWVALGLAVTLVAGVVAAPMVQAAYLKGALPRSAAEALAAAEANAHAQHRGWLDAARAGLGLANAPAYSVVYDICYVDHSDAGWMVDHYNYRCQLTYLDFVDGADHAALDQAVDAQWGTRMYRHMMPADYLQALGKPDDDRAPSHVAVTTPEAGADARAILDETLVTSGIVAYASSQAFQDRRVLAEAGSPQLDPAQRYVIFSHTHEYLRRDIGCAIARPPFCLSPLGG